ncbi:hypothetical protein YC2023_032048 [Brassica napus]
MANLSLSLSQILATRSDRLLCVGSRRIWGTVSLLDGEGAFPRYVATELSSTRPSLSSSATELSSTAPSLSSTVMKLSLGGDRALSLSFSSNQRSAWLEVTRRRNREREECKAEQYSQQSVFSLVEETVPEDIPVEHEGSQSETSHAVEEERPPGVKAAKGKNKNVKGEERLSQFQTMWEIKQKDLVSKDTLSRNRILDRLLAKQEPLDEVENAVVKKLLAELLN